jgi:hypothetical protein
VIFLVIRSKPRNFASEEKRTEIDKHRIKENGSFLFPFLFFMSRLGLWRNATAFFCLELGGFELSLYGINHVT